MPELTKIYYTKEEGGVWHPLRVHSIRLPNGTVLDTHFKGFRPGVVLEEPPPEATTGDVDGEPV